MKHLGRGLLWATTFVVGIAAVQSSFAVPTPIPVFLRLTSPDGFASACPVVIDNNLLVFTARHLIDASGTTYVVWEDNTGKLGRGTISLHSQQLDLALMTRPDDDAPAIQFPLLATRPLVGSPVYWWEYDHADYLKPILRVATVMQSFGGLLILSQAPSNGASGTCVFLNTPDRPMVVGGIIIGGTTAGDPIGIATALWHGAPWIPAP